MPSGQAAALLSSAPLCFPSSALLSSPPRSDRPQGPSGTPAPGRKARSGRGPRGRRLDHPDGGPARSPRSGTGACPAAGCESGPRGAGRGLRRVRAGAGASRDGRPAGLPPLPSPARPPPFLGLGLGPDPGSPAGRGSRFCPEDVTVELGVGRADPGGPRAEEPPRVLAVFLARRGTSLPGRASCWPSAAPSPPKPALAVERGGQTRPGRAHATFRGLLLLRTSQSFPASSTDLPEAVGRLGQNKLGSENLLRPVSLTLGQPSVLLHLILLLSHSAFFPFVFEPHPRHLLE